MMGQCMLHAVGQLVESVRLVVEGYLDIASLPVKSLCCCP